MDVNFAVFKTICGALLRRPGGVRFPSIPAGFRGNDSHIWRLTPTIARLGGTASTSYNPCGLRAALPSGRMAIFGHRCSKLEELLGMSTIHRLRSTDAVRRPLTATRDATLPETCLPAKRERDRIRHRRGGEYETPGA